MGKRYESRRRVRIIDPNRKKSQKKNKRNKTLFNAARTKYPYQKRKTYYGPVTNNKVESKIRSRKCTRSKFKPKEYYHSPSPNSESDSAISTCSVCCRCEKSPSRSYSEYSDSSSNT